MKRGVLTRKETGPDGTFGDFVLDGGAFKCKTAERPWNNNDRGTSCVPRGVVVFKLRKDSPKHGIVYEEWDDPSTPKREDVVGRDNIQIHAANFPDQLLGCIALGQVVCMISQAQAGGSPIIKKGVTASKKTMTDFMAYMNGEDLELTIEGVC